MLGQTDADLGPREDERQRDEGGQQSFGVSDKRRELGGTVHRFSFTDTDAVNWGVVSRSQGREKGGCGIPEQTKRCLHHAPPPSVCSTLPLRMRRGWGNAIPATALRPRQYPEAAFRAPPEWAVSHSPKSPSCDAIASRFLSRIP